MKPLFSANSASRPSLEPKPRPCPTSPRRPPCPAPCTHFWKQCAADSTHCGCTRTPPQKNSFSKNRAACQGCECGRQSSPLMMRLLPPQARDPEGGGRTGGPGSEPKLDFWGQGSVWGRGQD